MARTASRPVYPLRLEESYARRLSRVPRVAHKLLNERLGPLLKKLGPDIDARARGDSAASDVAEILRVIERVRVATERAAAAQVTEDELLAMAGRVDRFAAAELARTIALDVTQGGKLTAIYEAWAAENASLITSIPSQYFDDIAQAARESVRTGSLTRDLVNDLESRYGVATRRAETIARDQIGKLNGQLTERRQTSLGIEEFIWSTSRDERVRPSHAELEGTKHRWDDLPIVDGERSRPGSPIQCRCVAIAVMPE